MSFAQPTRLALGLSLLATLPLFAQNTGSLEKFPLLQERAGLESAAYPGEELLTEQFLRDTLGYLAADDKMGRKPGSEELEDTIFTSLSETLSKWGLQPVGNTQGTSFRQPFRASSWWPILGLDEPDFFAGPQEQLFCAEPDQYGFLIDKHGNPLTMDESQFLGHLGRQTMTPELRQTVLMAAYNTHNLVAMLPGSDPELKDEVLVLGAHIDHLGSRRGQIYNGADDNGSGSAILLNIAKAFSTLKKEGKGPARSILFIWFSAEEMGLLGSQYWVKNPTIDLSRVKAMLNMDMLGRADSDEISLYDGAGSKQTVPFHQWHDTDSLVFEHVEHDLQEFVRRSDQYPFFAKGIPVMFFFEGFVGSGGHTMMPDYHRPGDTVDKIDFTKLLSAARFVFRHAHKAAHLPLQ
jgi:hypothetical protein